MNPIWEAYRAGPFERRVRIIQSIVKKPVPVEVDWASLGDDATRSDGLDYDLEMFARGLEGVDRDNPYARPEELFDFDVLVNGISRIHIQRVKRMEQCECKVEFGTLKLRFCWEARGGSFEATEIEALMLDRDLKEFSKYVPAPVNYAPELLREVYRNRLPARWRRICLALGKPVKIDIDWNSLGSAPEAAPRLRWQMEELGKALRTLSDSKAERYGTDQDRARSSAIALARSNGVRTAIDSIQVRGGSVGRTPHMEFSGTTLKVCIHTDPPQAARAKADPTWDLRGIKACTNEGIAASLRDGLKLELLPLLQQLRNEDLPKAQNWFRGMLNSRISACKELHPARRINLRQSLEALAVTVDLDSFHVGAANTDTAILNLKTLQTGQYNYDCHYGSYFKNLAYGLEQATADDEGLVAFIENIRELKFGCVHQPHERELGIQDYTLVIRQCPSAPYDAKGMFDSEVGVRIRALVLAANLANAQNAKDNIATRPPAEPEAQARLERLAALFGSAEIHADGDLTATSECATELHQRGSLAVIGAITTLLDKEGYKELLEGRISRIEFHATSGDPVVAMNGSTLSVSVNPSRGPSGWLPPETIAAAIEEAFLLRLRMRVKEVEDHNRKFWTSSLRERFECDVPVEIDWEGFMLHPVAGGDKFYPLDLNESAIDAMIYALTGLMDRDASYKREARAVVRGLRFVPAPDPGHCSLKLSDDNWLVYHVFCKIDERHYFGRAELEERVYLLVHENAPDGT